MRVLTTKLFFALCLSAALVASWVLPAAAGVLPSLHTAFNKSKSPELVKVIPITRHRGGASRVAVSLGPAQVGTLDNGELVRGFGELQVSVTCTEQMPQCIGQLYRFSPHVSARLYLAKQRNSKSGFPIGKAKRLTCAQDLPNRNHHCVLALNDKRAVVSDTAKLPCDPRHCHLNLVVSAYHSGARSGNVLAIGTDENKGISQGKASLSVAIHRPPRLSAFTAEKTRRSKHPRVRHIPLGKHADARDERVIYSVRLADLRAGEQLIATARAHIGIASLPYNTLVQTRLILAESPSAIKSSGVPFGATSGHASFDAANGFNCTQGKSAFSDPCPVQKAGVVRMVYDSVTQPNRGRGARVPLYVNLVAGMSQEFGGHWHHGDRARVLRGSLRVERYPAVYKR
jgi:hypothetical protein